MDEIRPVLKRDRIACAISNWVLNHLASKWYRTMLDGTYRYGLMAAARDEAEGRYE